MYLDITARCAVQKWPQTLVCMYVFAAELISVGGEAFSLSDPFVRLKFEKKKREMYRVSFIFRNWRKKEFNDVATRITFQLI